VLHIGVASSGGNSHIEGDQQLFRYTPATSAQDPGLGLLPLLFTQQLEGVVA
jgi:hypothetical protein